MTSQNSDLFDSIRTAGRGALGKHKQYMWHPSDYVECQDEDGNDSFVCKDDKLRKMTYYVEELTGGAYGHAMIVYDALGGARRPVVVSGSFLDHVEVGWGRKREIDQSYGAPLNEAYAWRSGRRQDFTYGLLEESGQVIKWRLYPARINDGMSVGPGLRAPSSPGGEHWWDGRVSYLFVDAWNRTSKSHSGSTLSPSGFLGFPKNPSNADDEPAGVHYWTGLSENTRYLVQDFDGGEVGWNVIVYDTGNSEYRNEHQTFNQAFNIRGPIWRYFREHDGMNRFGPPVSDEIVDDGDPRKSSQRFRHGTLYLFQGVVSEAPNSCPVSGLGSMSCPTRHEVSCVSRPEGLQVTIHGPITDALVSGPVSNATAIQYGANHPPGPSPWVIPYPPGVSRPSVPWGGDDAVHIFLLPPDTNQFNFAVTNGSTASWFDIDTTGPQLWRATGNCTITHPSGGGGYFVRF